MVNARYAESVLEGKTDASDAAWRCERHAFGLLEAASFSLPRLQPCGPICASGGGWGSMLPIELLPVSRTPGLGVMMKLEVRYGSTAVHEGVQG
jgi:hypothetical protein